MSNIVGALRDSAPLWAMMKNFLPRETTSLCPALKYDFKNGPTLSSSYLCSYLFCWCYDNMTNRSLSNVFHNENFFYLHLSS